MTRHTSKSLKELLRTSKRVPKEKSTPKRKQVAGLFLRKKRGVREVLMVTSRDTGRWVLPKGWPMKGKTDPEAALQEAWEEAGVKRGRIKKKPFAYYDYFKGLRSGSPKLVRVHVYAARVDKIVDKFPEWKQRKRKWMSTDKAADLVHEPQLQEILRHL